MTNAQVAILIVMIVYMLAIIMIGFAFSKKNDTVGDFYLGGRKLGPLVTAMSAEASDMSSYLLMGLPGLAYLTGVADVGWTAIGLAVGTYLNWLFVARRLRRYTARTNSITVPDKILFSKSAPPYSSLQMIMERMMPSVILNTRSSSAGSSGLLSMFMRT